MNVNSSNCFKCHKELKVGAKFCGNCGQRVWTLDDLYDEVINESSNNDIFGKIFSLKVDKEIFEKEVINYSKLKITESFRGVSFLLLLFSAVITLLFILFADWGSEALVDVAICIIIGLLIYKGKTWAIVLAIIYWTYSKIYALSTSTDNFLVHFLWWIAYMRSFLGAYKVERLRSKLGKIYNP